MRRVGVDKRSLLLNPVMIFMDQISESLKFGWFFDLKLNFIADSIIVSSVILSRYSIQFMESWRVL